jgi:hypothetical protein
MSALVSNLVPLKRSAWRTRGGDPLAHRARWFALPLGGEFVVVDARHFHMDVDPVDQRAGEALLVARDHRR